MTYEDADPVPPEGDIRVVINPDPVMVEVTIPLNSVERPAATAFYYLSQYFSRDTLEEVIIMAVNVDYVTIHGVPCIAVQAFTMANHTNESETDYDYL